jgi:uncharacterized RmlC-like cupin family protein
MHCNIELLRYSYKGIYANILPNFGMFCYYQQGWCEIPGTADEVKTKLRMRQEGAIKRDRAMAYSLSTQVMKLTRSNACACARAHMHINLFTC